MGCLRRPHGAHASGKTGDWFRTGIFSQPNPVRREASGTEGCAVAWPSHVGVARALIPVVQMRCGVMGRVLEFGSLRLRALVAPLPKTSPWTSTLTTGEDLSEGPGSSPVLVQASLPSL